MTENPNWEAYEPTELERELIRDIQGAIRLSSVKFDYVISTLHAAEGDERIIVTMYEGEIYGVTSVRDKGLPNSMNYYFCSFDVDDVEKETRIIDRVRG